MAKKKTQTLYRAAKRAVKLEWGGKLWTIDSNYRSYPAEFVQTYAGWFETDQVPDTGGNLATDQVTDQVTDQDADQFADTSNTIETTETNTDIEVNNG